MRILALDPATNCGWCIWTPETDYIWGVAKFPKPKTPFGKDRLTGSERMVRFYQTFAKAIDDYQITDIVVEHNIMPNRSDANAELAYGWLTTIKLLAHNKKLKPAFKCTSGTWRSLNFGDNNKRAPVSMTAEQKRDWYKRRSIEKCQSLGYEIYNDDEAEALLLCRAHRISLDPQIAFEAGQSQMQQEELLI